MKDDAPYVLAMEYTLSWIIHNERVPFDKIKQTLLPDGPIDKESHCAMNKNAASPDESSVTATPIPNAAITELQKAASYVYKGKADLLSKNAYSSPHEPHTETPVPGNRVSLEHSPVYPCRNGVIKLKTGAIFIVRSLETCLNVNGEILIKSCYW